MLADQLIVIWMLVTCIILAASLMIFGHNPTVTKQKFVVSVIVAWTMMCVGMYVGFEYADMLRIDHVIVTGGCNG